ncbi:MAG TPA: type III pantothenate kinase [Phycisphaerales bacterium]|nr:type III pantothenate kinase [Phycisphaerales bacterium]
MDQLTTGTLLAVTVGNTRTRLGLFRPAATQGGELVEAASHANADLGAIAKHAREMLVNDHGASIVMSSVNDRTADELEKLLRSETGEETYRFGRDLHILMRNGLDDDSTVGQDRLLCAMAAYGKTKQACVIVDAGTAITVDFIDGEGVFQGGVIAPGLHMMLASLHEHTAALPKLAYETPDAGRGVFGKDTKHAMLLGVRTAAQGLVRLVVERYAEAYDAYPQIIATGGDAATLFEHDEVVEHVVPDLQLMGVYEACKRNLGDGDDIRDDASDDE